METQRQAWCTGRGAAASSHFRRCRYQTVAAPGGASRNGGGNGHYNQQQLLQGSRGPNGMVLCRPQDRWAAALKRFLRCECQGMEAPDGAHRRGWGARCSVTGEQLMLSPTAPQFGPPWRGWHWWSLCNRCTRDAEGRPRWRPGRRAEGQHAVELQSLACCMGRGAAALQRPTRPLTPPPFGLPWRGWLWWGRCHCEGDAEGHSARRRRRLRVLHAAYHSHGARPVAWWRGHHGRSRALRAAVPVRGRRRGTSSTAPRATC